MSTLMAEHAMALLLALARQLPSFVHDQQQRRWRRYPVERGPLLSLIGKTLLVLGVGGVGGEVARIAKLGFGMRVLGVTRTPRDHAHIDVAIDPAAWRAALGQVDVVSLSLPMTPATAGIIDATALAAMKPSALLINVARGKLVDEAALTTALEEGRLGGAGLDATAVEPLPATSRLWDLPNVLITPHTSAITDDLGARFVAFWADNIARFIEGQPLLGLVDKQAGY